MDFKTAGKTAVVCASRRGLGKTCVKSDILINNLLPGFIETDCWRAKMDDGLFPGSF